MKYLRLTNMFDCENVAILFSDELSINKLLDALHIPMDYVTSAGRFTFELRMHSRAKAIVNNLIRRLRHEHKTYYW